MRSNWLVYSSTALIPVIMQEGKRDRKFSKQRSFDQILESDESKNSSGIPVNTCRRLTSCKAEIQHDQYIHVWNVVDSRCFIMRPNTSLRRGRSGPLYGP